MDGKCGTHGKMRNAYKIIVGKPEGRSRRRWEDNIEMNVMEIEWEFVIYLAQYRYQWRAPVSTAKNHRVRENAGNFLTS
jgi:hypothetical protein